MSVHKKRLLKTYQLLDARSQKQSAISWVLKIAADAFCNAKVYDLQSVPVLLVACLDSDCVLANKIRQTKQILMTVSDCGWHTGVLRRAAGQGPSSANNLDAHTSNEVFSYALTNFLVNLWAAEIIRTAMTEVDDQRAQAQAGRSARTTGDATVKAQEEFA